MQTNYNEVAVLQQGAGKVTGARKFVKKVNIHMRDIEMSGKMKRLKRKMEVQKKTFNYFAQPQPRNWNFLCNDDDGHTKNIVVWFQNLLWVYGMAWMSVRFPSLKFCSSPPLLGTRSAFNPSKVHTHSSEHTHTHTVNTHPRHLCCSTRGAVGGSVVVESTVHSLSPPTIPAGPETRTRNLRVTSLTL